MTTRTISMSDAKKLLRQREELIEKIDLFDPDGDDKPLVKIEARRSDRWNEGYPLLPDVSEDLRKIAVHHWKQRVKQIDDRLAEHGILPDPVSVEL